MTEEVMRQRKIKSFRCSDQLLAMIQAECDRRNITFSGYVRDAMVAAMNQRRWIVS